MTVRGTYEIVRNENYTRVGIFDDINSLDIRVFENIIEDSCTMSGQQHFSLNFRQFCRFCRFSSNEHSVLSETRQQSAHRDTVKYETSADNNWSGTQAWRNRREGKRNEGDDKTRGK